MGEARAQKGSLDAVEAHGVRDGRKVEAEALHAAGVSPSHHAHGLPPDRFQVRSRLEPLPVELLVDALLEGECAPFVLGGDRLLFGAGDGAVEVLELQRAGGRRMSATEFLRGAGRALAAR